MKFKLIVVVMLTLLLASISMLILNIQPCKASPETIYVDDDNTAGPWDGTPEHPYRNITSALEYASVNDTIYVYNGTYYENVVVNKTVSLIGENKYNTVIDGTVEVTANNVKVSGFTLQSIWVDHSSDNNISHNVISDGIVLYSSNNNRLTGNSISNCFVGITVQDSSHNNLTANTLSLNHEGIAINFSSTNILTGNTVSNNDIGIGFIYSTDNTITSNTASNNRDGIFLRNSSNNEFFHNNLINNTKQVYDDSWVYPSYPNSTNTWDDGYPSGGNYWSDQYHGYCADHFNGPGQDISGSDGIVDDPYEIDTNNTDRYPLMEPWTPSPVGGIYIPVNKLELLAPYLGLTTLLAVAVISVGYVKKRKRHTEFIS